MLFFYFIFVKRGNSQILFIQERKSSKKLPPTPPPIPTAKRKSATQIHIESKKLASAIALETNDSPLLISKVMLEEKGRNKRLMSDDIPPPPLPPPEIQPEVTPPPPVRRPSIPKAKQMWLESVTTANLEAAALKVAQSVKLESEVEHKNLSVTGVAIKKQPPPIRSAAHSSKTSPAIILPVTGSTSPQGTMCDV